MNIYWWCWLLVVVGVHPRTAHTAVMEEMAGDCSAFTIVATALRSPST